MYDAVGVGVGVGVGETAFADWPAAGLRARDAAPPIRAAS
jgi:hypothetical protein